jgi:ribosome recycling factor
MIDDVVKDLKGRIDKTIDDLKRDLSRIRTGRANTSMLDGVRVNYYGTPTPLNGVASINVPEPRLITLKPYDKSAIKDIEKAINEANLGVTPQSDGDLIRLSFPPMTEERRKDVAKQVKSKGEEHKVAVRNIRRESNEALKGLQKDKKITEDDLKRGSEKVQKETDSGIARIDEVIAKKEKEVMEV